MGIRWREKIGEVYPTNNCGNIKILGLESGKILVQFEDGYVKKVRGADILSGSIANPNTFDRSKINVGKSNPVFVDRTGEVHKSNRFGVVTIVAYRGKKDCDIRFEDCGTISSGVQYDAIVKGQVTPHPRKDALSTVSFLKSSEVAHKWKFIYKIGSPIVNRDSVVEVICRKCGDVKTMKCGNHLKQSGCFNCTLLKREADRQEKDALAQRQREYDLILSMKQRLSELPTHISVKGNPLSISHKVDVQCEKHNHMFNIELEKVLSTSSNGCPSCKKEAASQRRWQKVTFDVFRQRADAAHNGGYEYNKDSYKSICENVEMTHKKCGRVFSAQATTHINGNYGKPVGCPYCATHGFSKGREGTMYLLYEPHHNMIKVGITHQAVESRVRQMTTNSIRKYGVTLQWEIVATKYYADGEACLKKEKYIHKILTNAGVGQPPFAFDGRTECFTCKPEAVLELFNQEGEPHLNA